MTAAVLVAAGLTAACRPDTVELRFRPRLGATFAYRVRVDAVTTTTIPGEETRVSRDEIDVRTTERVIATGPDGATLDMTLTSATAPARTFRIQVDRADQLVAVLDEEQVPSGALGPLSLADVLPRAAAPPPSTPLRPGRHWAVDEPVAVAGQPAGRVRGTATLASLGLLHGRKVAVVTSDLQLPASRSATVAGQTVTLSGAEHTSATVTRALPDGALEQARADTTGDYALDVGGAADHVHIELHARTDRVG